METLRKLRAVMLAAAFKIHKNRGKDKFVAGKWPKADHDERGERTWNRMDPQFLLKKLSEESFELEQDLLNPNRQAYPMLLEAGDVTALAMMICDRVEVFDELQDKTGFSAVPKIVCLCGSTKFKDVFVQANKDETLLGNIVLSVGCFPYVDDKAIPEDVLGLEVKEALDVLHKRKIDLCDEILVLNVGGYVGYSTRSEIQYARETGKPIRWLEQPKGSKTV